MPGTSGTLPSSSDQTSGKRYRRAAPTSCRSSSHRLAQLNGLLRREFRPVLHLSPLAGDIGSQREVAFVSCSLGELRRIGKSVGPGVTLNDVLLALVAGALRRWLVAGSGDTAVIRVQIPVSMHPHPGADDRFGNRDSFLLVDLPIGEADPVARLRAISAATHERKSRRDAQAVYTLRETVARLPVLGRGVGRLVAAPRESTLNVSNVPGPREPIYVLGRRVEALYSLAEVAPHHALRVAAVSMAGSLYVGLCADPGILHGLDDIAQGVRLSLDELHALVLA